MDCQASTIESALECMLSDESKKAKALPLSFLKWITNDFSDDRKIGCGGFSVVYKGLLNNGAVVAVKKLSQTFNITEDRLNQEVCLLMKVKHKNIVRILGYCYDTQVEVVEYKGKYVAADVCQKLLCFEYVPKGSLDEYIKDPSREWRKCYQIIKGVCEGLHYLHKELIVHLDLKPANILLDNGMVPKITDFGLSRLFDDKQSHELTSKLIGTIGYLAPEFCDNGEISFKSDIYSLGVIIIEILTAKKRGPPVEDVLECWMHKLEESQKEEQLEQIRVCFEVAKDCMKSEQKNRPCTQDIIDTQEKTESKKPCIETGSTVLRASSLVGKGMIDVAEEIESKKPCSETGYSSSRVQTGIKKQCAETGASISTVPQPSTLVENKKKSTGRYFKIEAFKSKMALSPETAARTIKAVTQTICQFYARDDKNVVFEAMYRAAYHVVLHKNGEQLYSAVETTMTSEVQSLCRPLNVAPSDDDVLFLQELLAKWETHIRAVKMTRDMLMYMEMTIVPTHHKTPIYDLGLRLWREEMPRSDKIRQSLIESVKRQRGGEDELVAGVNKMLAVLAGGVNFFRDSAGKLRVAGP